MAANANALRCGLPGTAKPPELYKSVKITGNLSEDTIKLRDELFDEEAAALEALISRLKTLVDEEVAQLAEPSALMLKDLDWREIWTDRFLVNCLFARKLDIDRTCNLLRKNFRFRASYTRGKNFAVNPPKPCDAQSTLRMRDMPLFAELDPQMKRCDFLWSVPGARSKKGEALLFGNIKAWKPADYDHDDCVDYVLFVILNLVQMEGVDACRHGFLFVVDADGLGWANFDRKLEARMAEVYQDNFPLRYGKFIMLNAPFVARAMMQIGKLFLKKKMIERVSLVDRGSNPLPELVDTKFIPRSFGGELDYDQERYLAHVEEWEAEHSPYVHARREHEALFSEQLVKE